MGAVIVTLAVKSVPETTNVVGEDKDPEHDVKVADGVDIVSSLKINDINVYGDTEVFHTVPSWPVNA